MTRPSRRPTACAVALVLLATALPAVALDGRHSQDASLFSAQQYHDWIAYLASDELEGRGTGQPGIDKAAEHIAEVFERYGVRPAGDEGSYFQNFTVQIDRRIGEDSRLAIGTKGRRTRSPARLNEDFVPFPFSASGRFKGEVVFAGYGIVSGKEGEPEYNDYAELDVTDKVVLVLRRGPEFSEFGMRHLSFRAKARKARDRDAAALLVVNRDGDDSGLYGTGGRSRRGGGRPNSLPMMHISRETADRMLAAGGLPDVAELQRRIEETKQPVSAPLEGVSVRGFVDIQPITAPARNVVGLIPGEGPQKDEIIVLGAHYDHLGIRKKGDADFDPEKHISNGADDNASGTAMVLNMARVFTQGEKPNRSILLIAFTGEERGLLGSQHFASHPTVDLKQCVAMLNFDMVGRLKDDRLEVGGMRTGGFEEMMRELGDEYGLEIKDGGGGRGPSDHTSFYRKDIPVLFFFTGIHKQYHRPEDDTHRINVDGAMRIARLVADVIDRIDARPERPAFEKDSRRALIARQGEGERKQPGAARCAAASGAARGVRLGILPRPDERPGVLIARVLGDSPAAKAGVKEGDRLLWIGDSKIEAIDDAIRVLGRLKQGTASTLVVERKGKRVELAVRFGSPAPRPVARAERGAQPEKKKGAENPHGDIDEDSPVVAMPPVRLGIMPTYGQSTGEGYEIAGVTEGGAAAKAGLRDGDRIYRIGKHKITDVYSYMDALRSFKPGDVIRVIVIRDGEKVELKVKAAAPKVQEPA